MPKKSTEETKDCSSQDAINTLIKKLETKIKNFRTNSWVNKQIESLEKKLVKAKARAPRKCSAYMEYISKNIREANNDETSKKERLVGFQSAWTKRKEDEQKERLKEKAAKGSGQQKTEKKSKGKKSKETLVELGEGEFYDSTDLGGFNALQVYTALYGKTRKKRKYDIHVLGKSSNNKFAVHGVQDKNKKVFFVHEKYIKARD